MSTTYEVVIGLEVHAQLLTKSKIFCGCSTEFGAEPNSLVCPICLGMPGVLPVLNKSAVEFAMRMGLATNCKISNFSKFARKNYFYPDLPKGYQISQYELPLCQNGYVEIENNGKLKKIRLHRIHLEEDAGKSIHDEAITKGEGTFIDVNRCGVPLIEIVSEPDISSAQEASLYLMKLKQLVQYLDICSGNMEEGNLRCDANISLRPVGSSEFGTKTEVKNMNSFKNVEKAIEFEIKRQTEILSSGVRIVQETLLWDANVGEARPMRSKEEAHDYRYFPEPDLVPLVIDEKWKNEIKNSLPELPDAKRDRFVKVYGIPRYDAEVLTATKEIANYYEECLKYCSDTKLVSNWVMSEVLRVLKDEKIEIMQFSIEPKRLSEMLNLIIDGTISGKIAKTVFEELLKSKDSAKEITEKKGLVQVTDTSAISKVIDEVISENPSQLEQYRAGKEKLFGFFVGEVMKKTKGKANPKAVNDLLKEKLVMRDKK